MGTRIEIITIEEHEDRPRFTYSEGDPRLHVYDDLNKKITRVYANPDDWVRMVASIIEQLPWDILEPELTRALRERGFTLDPIPEPELPPERERELEVAACG